MSASIIAILLAQGEDFILVQSAGNGNAGGGSGSEPVDALQNRWFCSVTEETPVIDTGGVTIQDVLDRIIVVGNAERTEDGYRCNYDSSFGTQVDLCAPGTGIYSTFPGNTVTGFEVSGGYVE